jgi:hypothetical protein
MGKNLNRDWDKLADPQLSPENCAPEKWPEGMIQAGQAPHLALALHNDGGGQPHISRPPAPRLPTRKRLSAQWWTYQLEN